MIENIKLSQRAKEQLIVLKRKTGIKNWNVLCRWAFCLSLSEQSMPRDEHIPADSSVEMTWKTFGGDHHEIYMALLLQRCRNDKIPMNSFEINKAFKQHLHRGISYLNADKDLTLELLIQR